MAFYFKKIIRKKILDPLAIIMHDSRSIGIVLISCTAIALFISNTSIGPSFFHLLNNEISVFHNLHLPPSLLHFINDGLMSVFFFLAAMEIKRELLHGELSSPKKALLPAVAAIGGMIVPAVFFYLFNKETAYSRGWAIPTATDIAFSLGVASLLAKRVPVALKIFLTALAIIDDLGAIIVIAIFYGGVIKVFFLLGCAVVIGALFLLNKFHKTFGALHFLLALLLWFCMYNSGIHATVAGVLFAFFIPTHLLSKFEIRMHKPVYFFVMPLFALANTAIILPPNIAGALGNNLSWGIITGLYIGKPIGILLFCYLLVKSRMAQLPSGVNWLQMTGAGLLAGIGFTMSIFISSLAFVDNATKDTAKIAVLTASLFAMFTGYLWLKYASRKNNTQLA